jgi:hypothetical protein
MIFDGKELKLSHQKSDFNLIEYGIKGSDIKDDPALLLGEENNYILYLQN